MKTGIRLWPLGNTICVLAFVIGGICACSTRLNVASFDQSERQIMESYFGTSIDAAERALFEQQKLILKYQSNNVPGLAYGQLMSQLEARMFVLYEFKGDAKRAEEHFITCYRISRQDPSLTLADIDVAKEKQRARSFVSNSERRAVLWKHPQAPPGTTGPARD